MRFAKLLIFCETSEFLVKKKHSAMLKPKNTPEIWRLCTLSVSQYKRISDAELTTIFKKCLLKILLSTKGSVSLQICILLIATNSNVTPL